MARDITRPQAVKPRHPTDLNQMHGNILNPPRMMQMGGADALHKPNGPHKNKLSVKKPGTHS